MKPNLKGYWVGCILAFNKKLKKYFNDFGIKEIYNISEMALILNDFAEIGDKIIIDIGKERNFDNFKRVELDNEGNNFNYLRILGYENENRFMDGIERQDLKVKPLKMFLAYDSLLAQSFIALKNAETKEKFYTESDMFCKERITTILTTAEPLLFHPRGSIYTSHETKATLIEKLKC